MWAMSFVRCDGAWAGSGRAQGNGDGSGGNTGRAVVGGGGFD